MDGSLHPLLAMLRHASPGVWAREARHRIKLVVDIAATPSDEPANKKHSVHHFVPDQAHFAMLFDNDKVSSTKA